MSNQSAFLRPEPSWSDTLQHIPALRLRLPLLGDHVVPGASAVRGAIGHQLMALDDKAALACLFPSEAQDVSTSRWGACPPWSVYVDVDTRVLEIGVFADALQHLPALLSALLVAARGRVGNSGSLPLGAISYERSVSCSAWCQGLPDGPTNWAMPPTPSGWLRLKVLSPLRLRRNGKDLRGAELMPRDLIANLMRRLTSLALQSGLPEPAWDARALLDAIEPLRWVSPQLHWSVLGRYSQRQKAEMQLGGVTGTACLSADAIGELWPVLWMGQFIHAGKTPSLGMGRYAISACEQTPAGVA